MIVHFFPRHPMVFFISKYKAIFKLRGFDFIHSKLHFPVHRHKLTWQVDVQRCKPLHATIRKKLITVAKGKAKIEMSSFF